MEQPFQCSPEPARWGPNYTCDLSDTVAQPLSFGMFLAVIEQSTSVRGYSERYMLHMMFNSHRTIKEKEVMHGILEFSSVRKKRN